MRWRPPRSRQRFFGRCRRSSDSDPDCDSSIASVVTMRRLEAIAPGLARKFKEMSALASTSTAVDRAGAAVAAVNPIAKMEAAGELCHGPQGGPEHKIPRLFTHSEGEYAGRPPREKQIQQRAYRREAARAGIAAMRSESCGGFLVFAGRSSLLVIAGLKPNARPDSGRPTIPIPWRLGACARISSMISCAS